MAKKKAKAKRRGLKKGTWTKQDVAMLKKLFGNNPTAEVAKQLERSLDNVKKKASRMELRKSKKYMKTLGKG